MSDSQDTYDVKLPDTATRTESVLLIDDDVDLCDMLQEYLSFNNWKVHVSHRASTGLSAARELAVDLVVLDVMLPDLDGFEVLRRLRHETNVLVLMLTARGEELDRIAGLEMGADDYLSKPFNPRELLARMRAVVRRSTSRRVHGADLQAEIGAFIVDPRNREAFFAGHRLDLTDIEFSLFKMFLARPHEVLDREEVVQSVFERPYSPLDRSLDVHVSRLRRKLESLPDFGGTIRAVRNRGYMLITDSLDEGDDSPDA